MRFLLPALLLFTLALPAGADPAASPAPPTPKKLTLAQALAAAPPPADGLLLSVSAEQVTLPDGAEPPPVDASLSDIAAAFGDQTTSFGTVTATAPQTMILLNTQPDAPNIAADLGYSTAFKMLTASLDDTQWQALTSERGLGLNDLSDDTQRGLFHALFPHGQLWVGSADPALRDVPQEKRTDVQNMSDQIEATRLRLGQTAKFYLHNKEGGAIFHTLDRPDSAQRLSLFHPKHAPTPTEHGVELSAVVPNALKSSDLDYDRRVLQVSVSAAGVATVGALVTRIGQKTGLELYADPHYAARTLTVQGAAATEPAADLLRALCLCVTGTFRKVGPAYVLTDDLMGVGTRRKHLEDWEGEADYARDVLGDQAGSALLHHHASTARKLPALGDPLAVTPEEMAALPEDGEFPGLPKIFGNSWPIAKLSPAQQAWIRQAAAEYNDKPLNDPQTEAKPEADATHDVDLKVNYQVQFLIPGQSQPIDAFNSPLFLLYYPSEEELMANSAPTYAAEQAKALAKLPPAPPLSAALRLGRYRDVTAHPRSAKDVDALVAAMQKLGLNTLVLDVFSGGVSHVKTNGTNGTDILTEALARTRGTGISVFADLSLLSWGDAPPDGVQDLTIDGQNSRQAALQARQINPHTDYDYNTGKLIPFALPPVSASPSSPQVQTTLTALVQETAARPGLAGFLWEDAAVDSGLGYTPDRRLAFLRSAHADPVDTTEGSDALQAKTKLPLFDDAAVDTAVSALWTKAQTQVNTNLLEQLRAAAQAGGVMPILMEQGWNSNLWYASWDDPKSQPPPQRELSFDGNYDENEAALKGIARAQGHLVLRREAIENDGASVAMARQLQDDAKTLPGDGFVLDFRHEEVTQGAAPLDALVRAVSAESRKVSGKTVEKTVK